MIVTCISSCGGLSGWSAGLRFLAAPEGPLRFKSSRTVAAHFGLTPRRYQSGESDNPGRISRAGDRNVRSTLYSAANAMLMRTMAASQLKSWGMRLMRTKGRRRAVVAVARRLDILMHRMWIENTEFRLKGWRASNDLSCPKTQPNGIVLSGRGLWMRPNMAAAELWLNLGDARH